MDELPHRSVIDLKATLGEFDHEPSQGEVSVLDPLQQPDAVRARDRPWLVTAHLARCDAAGLAQPPDPVDCRADSYPRTASQPDCTTDHRSAPPQPRAREDHWNKACPSILASLPTSMLNQNPSDLGIPNRFSLTPSRSRLLVKHDLFRKPVSTFRDHALANRSRYSAARQARAGRNRL